MGCKLTLSFLNQDTLAWQIQQEKHLPNTG